MAVSCQKISHAQRRGAVLRPDHHDVAEALCDELNAAKDERAHQDVAELGVALNQRLDMRVIQFVTSPSSLARICINARWFETCRARR